MGGQGTGPGEGQAERVGAGTWTMGRGQGQGQGQGQGRLWASPGHSTSPGPSGWRALAPPSLGGPPQALQVPPLGAHSVQPRSWALTAVLTEAWASPPSSRPFPAPFSRSRLPVKRCLRPQARPAPAHGARSAPPAGASTPSPPQPPLASSLLSPRLQPGLPRELPWEAPLGGRASLGVKVHQLLSGSSVR